MDESTRNIDVSDWSSSLVMSPRCADSKRYYNGNCNCSIIFPLAPLFLHRISIWNMSTFTFIFRAQHKSFFLSTLICKFAHTPLLEAMLHFISNNRIRMSGLKNENIIIYLRKNLVAMNTFICSKKAFEISME